MSIARVIAEAHGGSADAANTPQGGADVWLALPRERAPVRQPEPSTRSRPSSGSVSQEATERT
jgi:hypothetical protein